MKRLAFILIAGAALLLGSCQLEGNKDVVSSEGPLTTITAGREARSSTKSALTEEGENLWSVGDQILVGYAGQTPTAFTSKEKEPSQTAKFTGLLSVNNSGDNTLYAIYPAEDGNTVNKDGTFSLQFHADQTGVANTYDPAAFLAVAESQDKNLSFYNVLGLLKMQVADADIVLITLKPGAAPAEEPSSPTPKAVEEAEESSGVFPGGVLTVKGGSAPEVTGCSEELESISLSAPDGGCFDPDAFYYMAVAPCILKNGAIFELEKEDGSTFTVTLEGEKPVERSKIHDVGLLEKHIPVTEVKFDNEAEEVVIDGTITLIPTVSPEDASDPTLTWSSSDESIATVDEEGNVTGVAEGEAVITATSVDGPSGSVTVTVYPPYVAVQSITLSPSPLYIPANGSASVTVEYVPENADNKDVEWIVGDGEYNGVAEVDENGTVTGVWYGETTLRATSVDGPYDEIDVIVYAPIEDVMIWDYDLPMPLYIGNGGDLNLEVFPPDASYSNVQWSSSDQSVATVSSSGEVTAIAAGSVTITVTVKDIVGTEHSGQITISVSDPIQEIYIGTDDDLSEFHVGNSIAMYSETRPVEGGSVEWASSDPEVAIVDSDGTVTAQKVGKTIITATAANGVKSNEVEVEVYANEIGRVGIEPTYIDLFNMDDTETIEVSIYPPAADDGSHTITFSGYDTSLIYVDNDGTVTAVAPGEGFTSIDVYVDGDEWGDVAVYVSIPYPIEGIEFSYESIDMFYEAQPGDSGQLTFVLMPEVNNDGVYESIDWYSSNDEVASVDDIGVVTINGYGDVTITVTVKVDSDHSYSDSISFSVNNYSVPEP